MGRGYRGATFQDAVSAPAGGPGRSRSRSTTRTCPCSSSRKPILDRLGLVGTVFVPTDYPDRDEPMAWPGIDQWLGGPHREPSCAR